MLSSLHFSNIYVVQIRRATDYLITAMSAAGARMSRASLPMLPPPNYLGLLPMPPQLLRLLMRQKRSH